MIQKILSFIQFDKGQNYILDTHTHRVRVHLLQFIPFLSHTASLTPKLIAWAFSPCKQCQYFSGQILNGEKWTSHTEVHSPTFFLPQILIGSVQRLQQQACVPKIPTDPYLLQTFCETETDENLLRMTRFAGNPFKVKFTKWKETN